MPNSFMPVVQVVKPCSQIMKTRLYGVPAEGRTRNLQRRRLILYPIALRVHIGKPFERFPCYSVVVWVFLNGGHLLMFKGRNFCIYKSSWFKANILHDFSSLKNQLYSALRYIFNPCVACTLRVLAEGRTRNLQRRRLILYPIALRVHIGKPFERFPCYSVVVWVFLNGGHLLMFKGRNFCIYKSSWFKANILHDFSSLKNQLYSALRYIFNPCVACTLRVLAGARTRTEGVGGLYGIQFHHGHIVDMKLTAINDAQRCRPLLLREFQSRNCNHYNTRR